jgi:acyl-CoA thioesterase-1
MVGLAGALLAVPALADSLQAEAEKPRVLILGDSISIGYMPEVKSLLKDEAFVARPMGKNDRAENCAGTNNGIKNVDRWLKLEGGNWDVIHFNFGLHDLKREDPVTHQASNNPSDPHQASPEVYEKQLREIVEKLKATGATLIFATTTPVPEGGVKPHRDVADPEKYNALAKKIMKDNGVAVNDLYAIANPKLKEIQRPVNVHFTPEGSKLLGAEVVKHIRQALKSKPEK